MEHVVDTWQNALRFPKKLNTFINVTHSPIIFIILKSNVWVKFQHPLHSRSADIKFTLHESQLTPRCLTLTIIIFLFLFPQKTTQYFYSKRILFVFHMNSKFWTIVGNGNVEHGDEKTKQGKTCGGIGIKKEQLENSWIKENLFVCLLVY